LNVPGATRFALAPGYHLPRLRRSHDHLPRLRRSHDHLPRLRRSHDHLPRLTVKQAVSKFFLDPFPTLTARCNGELPHRPFPRFRKLFPAQNFANFQEEFPYDISKLRSLRFYEHAH
jgi:hypothetical protein